VSAHRPSLPPNPDAGARGLLLGDRGSESVEFAVVAVVVALGWLIAQQWLQTAIVARIHDLQA
jgi:Flp pilus assembly pilin Flp